MKRYQKGEVVLVVMVVMMVAMMAVVWQESRHIGMMGHDGGHAEKSGDAAQQTKAEPPQSPAPEESSEHQH